MRTAGRVSGLISAVVGGLVLVGWPLEVPILRSLIVGSATMKPITALCFVLAGIALWLLAAGSAPRDTRSRRHAVAYACALIVFLVATISLVELAVGASSSIGDWLFRDELLATGVPAPGQMSLATAFCFAVVGFALLSVHVEIGQGHRPAQYLALVVILVALVGFEGYLLGMEALFHFFPYASMAIHTAMLLLMLGFGILGVHADRGLMAVTASDRAGGLMARWLLPIAFVLPTAIGWPLLRGVHLGWYENDVSGVLFVTTSIILFTVVIWLAARMLNRADRERERADEATRRAVADLVSANAQLQTEIAERIRAETDLRTAQQRIIEQERMSALGQLASGIAHDFNNTLGPILGYSDLLLARPELLADTPRATEYLDVINTAAQGAASVVSRLRDFYRRRQDGDAQDTVAVPDLIADAMSLTRPRWHDEALARGAAIEVRSEADAVPPIEGDRNELRDALMNVILNAADALPTGGTIIIRARTEQHARGVDQVLVEVTDDGVGMSDEVRRRCLEPFFSTKGDRGSGLGLSMVHGTLRRHRGSLEIDSAVGAGTTVRFRLPGRRVGVASASTPPELAPQQAVRRSLSVLIVDDLPEIRRILDRFLTLDGHVVQEAVSGQEALAKLQASAAFDLIITDRAMPDMGGDELAARARAIAPSTPILMLTGFGELMEAANERPHGVDLVVGKPVTLARLRSAIATLVAESPPAPRVNPE